jgi:transcriptional regulator of acetoin/glycerol metabolism
MGALVISRSIIHSLESSIGLKGVREDDEFMLDLFQERRRVFRLKRTKYKIVTAPKFYFDFASAEIHLPVFGSAQSEFELALVQHSGSTEYNEKSRYLIKSLGESPFRLNGVQCFEAFIERGDVIDIGFNRIKFLRPKSHLKISEKAKSVIDLLTEEMIKSPLNIMIEGETGTGKTTLAKTIHEESARSGRFIHLNLSSFAPSLIESELFGHVKGAFTGAITEKRGAILEAHKGTLFLDEIDSLSLELQTKLLLFLDNYEVRAVGGSTTQKADVRLIFASGTKMKQLIQKQKMRRDFYYRLTSGVVVTLENLRDNPAKISEFCLEFEKQNLTILCEDLIKYYQECPWPGNIRQLLSHLNSLTWQKNNHGSI